MIAPLLVSRFVSDLAAAAGPLEPPFAVAVSGGPDSVALLLLSAAAFPGGVRAATVDHGLRPEARGEAGAVARLCKAMGVPHAVLPAVVERSGEGTQAAAREARYRALAGWMGREGLVLLLTGHHADDQAETLVMRMNRGSGVAGLAGIRRSGAVPGAHALRVARPLLGWRREELGALVRGEGIEAAADPSNADPAYDRARIRMDMAEVRWLDRAGMARSADALAQAEESVAWAAERLVADRVEQDASGVSLGPEGVPPELLRRVVLACLRRIAPEAAPRGEKLSALIAALEDQRTATLAGVKAEVRGDRWLFAPAPSRRS